MQTLSENMKVSHLLLQERFRLREEEIAGSKARERHGAMEEGFRLFTKKIDLVFNSARTDTR